jgi:hypothetical protein
MRTNASMCNAQYIEFDVSAESRKSQQSRVFGGCESFYAELMQCNKIFTLRARS